jgi:iron complex transport system substrate-binding protein
MARRTGILAASALTMAAILLGMLPLARAGAGASDINGRPVTAEARARILSIGGDVTEILYAIGAQANVVAVDSTSQFPADALKEKKNVGYMRALATEGVLSTSPTMILASRGSGPPEVVKALKASGVPYVDVPDDHDPQGVAGKVRLVAEAAGVADKGEVLAKAIEQQFAELETDRRRVSKPLKAIFVLSVQKGQATVGGAGTSGDAILRLAGLENSAASFPGFKPMVDEALVEMKPDVIVVMKRSDPTHDALKALDDVKGIAATPAGKAKRIVAMDALYLLGFGPRAPAAARELMLTAYPELAAAETPSR